MPRQSGPTLHSNKLSYASKTDSVIIHVYEVSISTQLIASMVNITYMVYHKHFYREHAVPVEYMDDSL